MKHMSLNSVSACCPLQGKLVPDFPGAIKPARVETIAPDVMRSDVTSDYFSPLRRLCLIFALELARKIYYARPW